MRRLQAKSIKPQTLQTIQWQLLHAGVRRVTPKEFFPAYRCVASAQRTSRLHGAPSESGLPQPPTEIKRARPEHEHGRAVRLHELAQTTLPEGATLRTEHRRPIESKLARDGRRINQAEHATDDEAKDFKWL